MEGLDALIRALTVFRKYANPSHPTHCEHDELTVCVSPQFVSTEDLAELKTLGFLPSTREDCFRSTRFGSA